MNALDEINTRGRLPLAMSMRPCFSLLPILEEKPFVYDAFVEQDTGFSVCELSVGYHPSIRSKRSIGGRSSIPGLPSILAGPTAWML